MLWLAAETYSSTGEKWWTRLWMNCENTQPHQPKLAVHVGASSRWIKSLTDTLLRTMKGPTHGLHTALADWGAAYEGEWPTKAQGEVKATEAWECPIHPQTDQQGVRWGLQAPSIWVKPKSPVTPTFERLTGACYEQMKIKSWADTPGAAHCRGRDAGV